MSTTVWKNNALEQPTKNGVYVVIKRGSWAFDTETCEVPKWSCDNNVDGKSRVLLWASIPFFDVITSIRTDAYIDLVSTLTDINLKEQE